MRRVTKTPSQRDLVATFVALCESEGTEHQELEEFLVAHSEQLARPLGASISDLLEFRLKSPLLRQEQARRLLHEARQREQTAQASASQNLSLAATKMLALSAVWTAEQVTLDPRIVLGRNLLADRTRRFVRFDVEGRAPIAIRREKLCETGRALRFTDLSCAVTPAGLRFRWRQSKGGLLLTDQKVEPRHRDAVLSVVIARPRPAVVEQQHVPTRERRSGWLSDVFGELTAF